MIQASKHSYWGHKMETNAVAFQSIGFHTNLILNRLRNEKRIADDSRGHEDGGRSDDKEEQDARAELAVVKKRLDLLRSRVEPRRGGSAG